MYFKDFPKFLYDFNYDGPNNTTKTSLVRDITRNIRFRRDILSNITLYDEYDVIDGETPEIIAEKFYGSPEYHWVVMLANEKFDYLNDFPLPESVLQRHIADSYNPTLYSDDWYWDTQEHGGVTYIHIKVSATEVPFNPDYLTAPVKITLYDETKNFVKVINYPIDEVGLDPTTQYFYFPYAEESTFGPITQFGEGDADYGVGKVRIYIDTEGRQYNPVKYVNQDGFVVNPNAAFATPITGDDQHRIENDTKRRIKLISPKLLGTVLRNYKELL